MKLFCKKTACIIYKLNLVVCPSLHWLVASTFSCKHGHRRIKNWDLTFVSNVYSDNEQIYSKLYNKFEKHAHSSTMQYHFSPIYTCVHKLALCTISKLMLDLVELSILKVPTGEALLKLFFQDTFVLNLDVRLKIKLTSN